MSSPVDDGSPADVKKMDDTMKGDSGTPEGVSECGSEESLPQQVIVKDEEKQQRQLCEDCKRAVDPASTLVEFEGPNDPGDPRNWSVKRRIAISAAMGWMTFVVTFSSSNFAIAIGPIAEEFHVAEVTATLGVSLFLLGFVFGPIAFGPASEVWGRRIPLFVGYFVFSIFNIPVAVASNIETILVCRFLGGFAASAPLAVVAGAMADMWDPVKRSYAICAFASGTFCGPVAGPIIAGFVTDSYLGWRWIAWITLIMAALFGVIGLLVIPETSAPRILQLRARKLRHETGNWSLHAKADEQRITVNNVVTVYLARPFVMLVQEPILALMTAYISYLYGVFYLLFEAFPISFHEKRGWNLGVSALPFAAFIVGIIGGCAIMAYSAKTNFQRAYLKHGKPIPEERLPAMIIGAIILPISLFWFAWTSFPSITWVPQVISAAFIGISALICFWQGILYIIDVYAFYSNSAIAINTFIRSIAAAGFPLFAPAMYRSLGVPWATSLLAFLTAAFIPAPILFYKYGARIRARSKFAPTT